MIAYTVSSDVKSIATARSISSTQLHPPQILLTNDEHAYYKRAVDENKNIISYGKIPVSKGILSTEPTKETQRAVVSKLKHTSTNEFAQNDDTLVRIEFHRDPQMKSYLKIKHQFNYIDSSQPETQAKHLADIYLTHCNMLEAGNVHKFKNPSPYDYVNSHRLFDVSNSAWKQTLEHLYAHVVEKKPRYFDDLYNTLRHDNHLYLLHARQNELPFACNLFGLHQNMPVGYEDLKIAAKHTPNVFILIRGIRVPEILRDIMEQFKVLARSDPMARFFKVPHQQFVNDKSVRPTEEAQNSPLLHSVFLSHTRSLSASLPFLLSLNTDGVLVESHIEVLPQFCQFQARTFRNSSSTWHTLCTFIPTKNAKPCPSSQMENRFP